MYDLTYYPEKKFKRIRYIVITFIIISLIGFFSFDKEYSYEDQIADMKERYKVDEVKEEPKPKIKANYNNPQLKIIPLDEVMNANK